MRTKWLDRRIAAPGPYLALCLSEEEFVAALKHLRCTEKIKWVNDKADATAHSFDSAHGTTCIVCIQGWQGRNPIEVAGMLVHEAVHIWQTYAESIGEHNPGKEQEAYAIQSISQELLAEFALRMQSQ